MGVYNRSRVVWACWVLFGLGVPVVSAGAFAGGDGTAVNPYQIASPEQWVALSSDPNLWDKHFALIRDLDMVGVEPNAVGPVGSREEGRPFAGVLDGRNHTISNVRIVRPDWSWVGLFGQIGDNAAEPSEPAVGHVHNLHLRDIHMQGEHFVGGLVGDLSEGTIRNCSVIGTVTGHDYVGGLVGHASIGEIHSCKTIVRVQGVRFVGGLLGNTSADESLARCSSSGSVQGETAVGGLIGFWTGSVRTAGVSPLSSEDEARAEASVSRIAQCRSDCAVYGTEEVGGLIAVAYGRGEIQDCYALGFVHGETKVGGLIGQRVGGGVVRCFSAGPVRGVNDVGGLIGKSEPIEDANDLEDYPPCQLIVEKIEGANPADTPCWRVVYRPAVLACFWDRGMARVVRSVGSGGGREGITPLSAGKMANRARLGRRAWETETTWARLVTDGTHNLVLLSDQGWDFKTVWTMRSGGPYPRLQWELAP